MSTPEGGEVWESTGERLRLRRSIEPLNDDRILVRVTFANRTDESLVARVLEDVPGHGADLSVVTAAAGDPRACRHVGDWIVHEATVPGGTERKTAYVLDVGDDATLSIPPPRVRAVEPAEPGATDADHESTESRRPLTGGAPARLAIREAAPCDPVEASTPEEPPEREVTKEREVPGEQAVTETTSPTEASGEDETEAASGPDGDHDVVDAVLAALAADDGDGRKRELQATIGLTPSERARLRYVQSRIDEFAAYVDALEGVLDEHGTDVVADLREDVADNTERTAALDDAVAELRDVVHRYRAQTADEIGEIEADVAALDARLTQRIDELEESLDRTRRDLSELGEDWRDERQARAREFYRVEQSLADVEDAVDDLESDAAEFEEFKRRFMAAFESTAGTATDAGRSDGDGPNAENGRTPDADDASPDADDVRTADEEHGASDGVERGRR